MQGWDGYNRSRSESISTSHTREMKNNTLERGGSSTDWSGREERTRGANRADEKTLGQTPKKIVLGEVGSRAIGGFVAALILLFSAVAGGCGRNAPEPQPLSEEKTEKTLVFIDQSVSIDEDSKAGAIYQDSLERIVESRLDDAGDEIRLYAVNEKTESKAFRAVITNTARKPEARDFNDERVIEEARYTREVNQQIETAKAQVDSFFTGLEEAKKYRRWTDLWGSLPILSSEAKGADKLTVYYFSDMFESMKGRGRRNFDYILPKTKEEAREWAKEDIGRIKKRYRIDERRLPDINVRIIPGRLAAKEGGQRVKEYWQTVFRGIGVEEIAYNP